jgi:hypothetical protein
MRRAPGGRISHSACPHCTPTVDRRAAKPDSVSTTTRRDASDLDVYWISPGSATPIPFLQEISMTNVAQTRMPDRDELSSRVADLGSLEQGGALYDAVLALAGREITGPSVAVHLTLAVHTYLRPRDAPVLTREERVAHSRAALVLTSVLLPNLVNALIDDERVRAEALSALG